MMQVDDGAGLMSFVVDVGMTRTSDVDGNFEEDDDSSKVECRYCLDRWPAHCQC